MHLGPNTFPTGHLASPVTSILILENKQDAVFPGGKVSELGLWLSPACSGASSSDRCGLLLVLSLKEALSEWRLSWAVLMRLGSERDR